VVAKYASIHASDVSYLYPLCAGGEEPPLLSPYHDLVTSIPGTVREPIRLGPLGFLISYLVRLKAVALAGVRAMPLGF
jgi:hypothetical protein